VVKREAMKSSKRPSRSQRTDAARRAQVLAAFDRSGLSAAAFARQQHLHYTTFCGWRQRRDNAQTAPAFVQVEVAQTALAPAPPPGELVIELGAAARIRIASPGQLALAAQLLQHLNAARAC
jgi:hypothetical protein